MPMDAIVGERMVKNVKLRKDASMIHFQSTRNGKSESSNHSAPVRGARPPTLGEFFMKLRIMTL
jgi:hypothetical protein